MAQIEIKVPDIGDFKDVAVIELLVKAGDTIEAEQSLVTVESDKASMEIPSSHAGVVKELKVALGDRVNQGSVLLLLEADAAAAAAPAAATPPPVAPSSTTTTLPMLTLSPSLTRTSLTTPACDDGISIDALSDSTVTRL